MPTAFLRPFARPADEPRHTIVRGQGAAIFDDAGNRYVDALAGLWFCQVGHGRPELAEAVGRQLAELEAFHCFERFTNPVAEELCAELAASAPMPDARVALTSSGSEAMDTAIKLARMAMVRRGEPDRHVIVSRSRAYHGVTFGGVSAQGLAPNKTGFGPLLPGVLTVEDDRLDAVLDQLGDQVAAVITEPVQAAGGVWPPAPGFLEHLRSRCDELGASLVLDEVVTAFGRLGQRWAADRYGIQPDLVTFAKGVTSGYQPLGGVLVGRQVLDPLEADPDFLLRHGHTYSGHPAGARAALVNLAIIDDEELGARAEWIGAQLAPAFDALVADGLLAEVRGTAGIWAVRLPAGVDATRTRDQMMGRGVLPRPLGPDTLGFCPPLVIEEDDLDACTTVLRQTLQAATT